MKMTTATAMVLAELPKVLALKQNENGVAFDDLWKQLTTDKALAKALTNDKNEPRFGVLQGISTRIKTGKIHGVAIVKDEGGAKWYKVDDDLAFVLETYSRHLAALSNLKLPQSVTDKAQVKNFAELSDLLSKMNNVLDQQQRLAKQAVTKPKASAVKKTDTADSKPISSSKAQPKDTKPKPTIPTKTVSKPNK